MQMLSFSQALNLHLTSIRLPKNNHDCLLLPYTYRNRFQKDKLSAITLVCKQAYPGHRARSKEEEFVIAMDTNQQINFYQKVQKKSEVYLPAVSALGRRKTEQ